jgi:hypothetical protein
MLSIKLVDGTLINNVDWNSLPETPIKYMDYKIGNQTIRLMGFERYLRLKEMVYGVNIKLKGMSKVILVGQTGVICTRVTIDLINKKCCKDEVLFSEVYNGKSVADKHWKAGQILDNPSVFINRG